MFPESILLRGVPKNSVCMTGTPTCSGSSGGSGSSRGSGAPLQQDALMRIAASRAIFSITERVMDLPHRSKAVYAPLTIHFPPGSETAGVHARASSLRCHLCPLLTLLTYLVAGCSVLEVKHGWLKTTQSRKALCCFSYALGDYVATRGYTRVVLTALKACSSTQADALLAAQEMLECCIL